MFRLAVGGTSAPDYAVGVPIIVVATSGRAPGDLVPQGRVDFVLVVVDAKPAAGHDDVVVLAVFTDGRVFAPPRMQVVPVQVGFLPRNAIRAVCIELHAVQLGRAGGGGWWGGGGRHNA